MRRRSVCEVAGDKGGRNGQADSIVCEEDDTVCRWGRQGKEYRRQGGGREAAGGGGRGCVCGV